MRAHFHLIISAAVALSLSLAPHHGFAASHAGALQEAPRLARGITVYVWDPFPSVRQDRQRATLQRVVRGWERQSGNTVKLLGNTNQNDTKLCSVGAAGKGPDLIAVPHTTLGELTGCNTIRTIPGWALSPALKQSYIPAARAAIRINGQEWAMPWSIETCGIYYNQALVPSSFFTYGIRKVGKRVVRGPLQWTDIIRRAKSITIRKTGILGLAWGATDFYLDYGFVSANGGYVFKLTRAGYDPRRVGLDSHGSIAGIALIRNLSTAGKYKLVPSGMGESQALSLFAQSKLAMIITGSWNLGLLQERPIKLGFAPLPSVGSHPSRPFGNVDVFVVNKFSGHPNEAFSLLRYMTTHMELPEFNTGGHIPVIARDLISPEVQAYAMARGLARAANQAEAVPNIPEMSQVWGPMNQALTQVVRGKVSPATAARLAAQQIRLNIRRSGG